MFFNTIYSVQGPMLFFALSWYFSEPVCPHPCQFRQKLASQVDISEVQNPTDDPGNAGSPQEFSPSMATNCFFRTGSEQIAPQTSG
jgi:hypothetical protein